MATAHTSPPAELEDDEVTRSPEMTEVVDVDAFEDDSVDDKRAEGVDDVVDEDTAEAAGSSRSDARAGVATAFDPTALVGAFGRRTRGGDGKEASTRPPFRARRKESTNDADTMRRGLTGDVTCTGTTTSSTY